MESWPLVRELVGFWASMCRSVESSKGACSESGC